MGTHGLLQRTFESFRVVLRHGKGGKMVAGLLLMRTSSMRLDDTSEARLDQLCSALGLSQTEVVKAGLDLLQSQSLTPAH